MGRGGVGKYMNKEAQGEKGLGLGFTVGGDKQFYKWNYKTQMPSKD